MAMFIAFVVAIVSAALVGYLLGDRRTTGRDHYGDGVDAEAIEYLKDVERRTADIERQSEDAVREGNEAGQTIQDIVAGIRRSGSRTDDDPSDKGGN